MRIVRGLPVAVRDQATGTVVSRYNYDAFGARELEAGAELMDVGFTGREYDAETGLYHFRARVYDPDVGRFVQSDPIGFAAGDLNLYAYTWNDPGNWSDPSGLAVTTDWTIRSAAAVRLASRAVTGAAKKVAKEMVEESIEDATLCLASNAASVIGSFAANYATGGLMFDPDDPIKRVAECASEVMPLCGCKGGGVGAGSSFVPGTEVLTPDGKVAIEDLREGDLVVARHEVTGELGEFPITSLMAREAPGVIWLTLEDAAGKTSTLGVTDEHPLFVVGRGWTKAAEVETGYAVRDEGMRSLRVVAVEIDDTVQLVHNLEVLGPRTYFVGTLSAWGHNGDGAYVIFYEKGKPYVGKGDCDRANKSAKEHLGKGDKITSVRTFKAKGRKASFKLEDALICKLGGLENLQNEINSPGKKYRGRK